MLIMFTTHLLFWEKVSFNEEYLFVRSVSTAFLFRTNIRKYNLENLSHAVLLCHRFIYVDPTMSLGETFERTCVDCYTRIQSAELKFEVFGKETQIYNFRLSDSSKIHKKPKLAPHMGPRQVAFYHIIFQSLKLPYS